MILRQPSITSSEDPAACEATHRSVGRPTPPWLTVNTFLITMGERLMLVDAGYADNSPGAR